MLTHLLVEVLHEDGHTKFVREARLADVQCSSLLFEQELQLVPREFVLTAERWGKEAESILAPSRVADALRKAAQDEWPCPTSP